jgi:hypothetical protein
VADFLIPNTGNRQYDELPAGVKMHLTLREYLWLSDAEKANLVQSSTEPEWDE